MSGDKLSITLSELAHSKIKHWVDKKDNEVSGFGTTTLTIAEGNYHVYVHDVYLLEQEVGGSHTDIDASAMAKLMHKVLVNPETRHLKLNFWWHSHVKMETFWSGTDRETIKSIGKNGMCIASVFNQQGDIRSAICYKTSSDVFGDGASFVDEVKTYFETPVDERIAEWDKEFDACVKERAYKSTYIAGENRTFDEYETDWRVKHGALLTGGTTHTEKKFADERDHQDAIKHGLLGFGIDDEARALAMKPKKYIKLLQENDKNTLTGIEYQLEQKWEAGVLNG